LAQGSEGLRSFIQPVCECVCAPPKALQHLERTAALLASQVLLIGWMGFSSIIPGTLNSPTGHSSMAFPVRFCKRMDQRFLARQEHEFKRSLQPDFVVPLYVFAALGLCGNLGSLRRLCGEVDKSSGVWQYGFCLNSFLAILNVMTLLIVFLRTWIARVLRPVDLELYCLIALSVWAAAMAFGGFDWYRAKLFGSDPQEIFDHDVEGSEAGLLLTLCVATVFCCLVVPIRSHLSWMLVAWNVCLYCGVTLAVSSPHPSKVPNYMALVCVLSAMSVLGGFRHAAQLRKEWMSAQKLTETLAAVEDLDATIQGQQINTVAMEKEMEQLENKIQDRQDDITRMKGKIHSLRDQIDELEFETIDHAMPLPSEEPGAIPSIFRSKKLSSAGKTVQCPELLTGTWVLIEGKANLWLHRIEIHGDKVVLGDWTCARLRQNSKGQYLLEGGVLTFDDKNTVCRTGKSGQICRFKRCHTNPQIINDDEDRDSVLSVADSSSTLADGDVGHIEDSEDYPTMAAEVTGSSGSSSSSSSSSGSSSSNTITRTSTVDVMVLPSAALEVCGEGGLLNLPGQNEEASSRL